MDVLGEGDWIEAGRDIETFWNIFVNTPNISQLLPWGRRRWTWNRKHRPFWWCDSPWETWQVKELNGSFRGLRQSRSDDRISDCMVPYWGSPHLNRTWVASCSSVAACGGRSFVTKDGMKPDETQNSHLRSFDMDVVTTCWWRMWKLSFESSPREAQNAKQWLMDPRVVDKMIFTAILAAIVL